MAAPLDLDQLQTFITISDTGSFTRAADEVHRTQSAVSMQMRRLEERIGKPLFEKDGRTNRLTEEGERLLSYARRMMHLNRETLAAFDDRALEGTIRIGTPDDYADRFLPEIMARFARSNPRVELTVICEPTPGLVEHIKRGNLDLAIVTHNDCARAVGSGAARAAALGVLGQPRHARAGSAADGVRPADLHLAACRLRCAGQDEPRIPRAVFELFGHRHHCGGAVGPGDFGAAGMRARPGMRVLGEADGFGPLPDCKIGIMRGHTARPEIVDAIARHISDSLDNISVPMAEEAGSFDFAALTSAVRGRRLKPSHVLPGW